MVYFYFYFITKITTKQKQNNIKEFIYHFHFIRILHFWMVFLIIYKKTLIRYIQIVNNYENTFSAEIKVFLEKLCNFSF